ncbi:MAG: glycosyltransferase family 39 protein [Anaerolineae bacterium]
MSTPPRRSFSYLTAQVRDDFSPTWLKRRFRRRQPRYLLLTLLALLVGFALRVYLLDGQDLWGDEAFTLSVIRLPFAQVLSTSIDTHPPFYYALLHPWGQLGLNVFSLRFLSVVLSMPMLPLAYLAGAWLFDRRAGVLAAWLMALAPLQVYYAQELRMYSAAAMLALASTVLLIALIRGRGARWWVAYAVVTLAGMYTHYEVFYILPAQAAAVLIAWRPRRPEPTPSVQPEVVFSAGAPSTATIAANGHSRRNGYAAKNGSTSDSRPARRQVVERRLWLWLCVMGILALAYLPWVVGHAGFLLGHSSGKPWAWSLGEFWAIFDRGLDSYAAGLTLPWGANIALVLWLALAGVGIVGLYQRGRAWALALLGLGVLSPLLLGWLVDPAMPFFHERFVLVGAAPLLVAAAGGIEALWRIRRWLGPAALAAVLVIDAVALYGWYTNPEYIKSDYGQAMAAIASRAGPGDLIALSNPEQTALFDFYAPPGIPSVVLDPTRLDQQLARATEGKARVWLVTYGSAVNDPQRPAEAWLSAHGYRAGFESRKGFEVTQYLLASAPPPSTPTIPLDARFADGVHLVGADVTPQAVQPDGTLLVTLFWQADVAPQKRYTVFTQLLDGSGRYVAGFDGEPAGGSAPTTGWQPGTTITDRRAIALPADLPTGPLSVRVGLYAWPDTTRLGVTSSTTPATDNAVEVTTVQSAPR